MELIKKDMQGKYDNAVQISINEAVEASPPEPKVKDLVYTLNTGIEAYVTTTTEHINGELECVILSSSSPVTIKIVFEDYPELSLFEAIQYTGIDYFYLKKACVGKTPADVFEEVAESWALNNKLRIIVQDNFNAEVKVILRYC